MELTDTVVKFLFFIVWFCSVVEGLEKRNGAKEVIPYLAWVVVATALMIGIIYGVLYFWGTVFGFLFG